MLWKSMIILRIPTAALKRLLQTCWTSIRPRNWLLARVRPSASLSRSKTWLPTMIRRMAAMCWRQAITSSAPRPIHTMCWILKLIRLLPILSMAPATSAKVMLLLLPTSLILQRVTSLICPAPTALPTMTRRPLLLQLMK